MHTANRQLSPTMQACVDMARAAGGELIRYQGGYWAPRNQIHPEISGIYHGTKTVHALVDRGRARYSEHQEGRNGRFPIAIQIVEDQ